MQYEHVREMLAGPWRRHWERSNLTTKTKRLRVYVQTMWHMKPEDENGVDENGVDIGVHVEDFVVDRSGDTPGGATLLFCSELGIVGV